MGQTKCECRLGCMVRLRTSSELFYAIIKVSWMCFKEDLHLETLCENFQVQQYDAGFTSENRNRDEAGLVDGLGLMGM